MQELCVCPYAFIVHVCAHTCAMQMHGRGWHGLRSRGTEPSSETGKDNRLFLLHTRRMLYTVNGGRKVLLFSPSQLVWKKIRPIIENV